MIKDRPIKLSDILFVGAVSLLVVGIGVWAEAATPPSKTESIAILCSWASAVFLAFISNHMGDS